MINLLHIQSYNDMTSRALFIHFGWPDLSITGTFIDYIVDFLLTDTKLFSYTFDLGTSHLVFLYLKVLFSGIEQIIYLFHIYFSHRNGNSEFFIMCFTLDPTKDRS